MIVGERRDGSRNGEFAEFRRETAPESRCRVVYMDQLNYNPSNG